MSLERYESKEVKFSHWTLKELNQWNRMGLLPAHESQDIESMCAFFGALDVLTWFAPGVLTLVHGSAGCGLSLAGARAWPGGSATHRPRPLCTAMDAHHVVFGGEERLRQALQEVDTRFAPKLIVVLTNCCSYIIGEDVAGVVQSMAPNLRTDVLNLELAGSCGIGFRQGAYKAFDLLFDYISRTQPQPGTDGARPSINLFTKRVSGRPAELSDVEEIRRLLDKIKVNVNAVIRLGTPFEELAAVSRAQANATLCFTFGRGPLESLNRLFGQSYAPMTFPLGLEGTLAWIDQVAKLVGVPNTLPQDPEVAAARKKIDRLREKLAGREAYIWQPGEKGLATAVFTAELGMKPVLLGMSYYLEEQLRPTVEMLLSRGYDIELVLSGKYKVLMQAREIPLERRPLIFMPKKFWLGRCPGVTFNFFTDPLMGLKGIDTLVAEVERALDVADKKDYRLFNRYVEILYQAIDWQVDGEIIQGVDHEDPKWRRWNVR